MFLAPLGACESPDSEKSAEIPLPESAAPSGCGDSGSLETELFGSIETNIRWSGSNMNCENMLRPDNNGVRLRFAGEVAGETLAIIIALPTLQRATATSELPSNVTATVEGSGRFFSTPNLDACWTDIESQVTDAANENIFVVTGTLYCVTPLGEVNGEAAVSIPELAFTTLIEWAE